MCVCVYIYMPQYTKQYIVICLAGAAAGEGVSGWDPEYMYIYAYVYIHIYIYYQFIYTPLVWNATAWGANRS